MTETILLLYSGGKPCNSSLVLCTSGGYYLGELHRVLSEFAAGRTSKPHKSEQHNSYYGNVMLLI